MVVYAVLFFTPCCSVALAGILGAMPASSALVLARRPFVAALARSRSAEKMRRRNKFMFLK